MSGKDALSGFYYQIAVGVLRFLEMLTETGPFKIIFEEIDKNSEDIVCFYESTIEYEQVKRRENRVWSPGSIRDVIQRFFKREIDSSKEILFRFTTNSIPSSNTAESDILIRNIREGILQFSESDILHRLIPETMKPEEKKALIDRLSIIWAFHYSPDPRDSVKAIREACISQISNICRLDTEQAETIFGRLYELVSHYSSKERNYVYRADIRTILPDCLARLTKSMIQEIPEECQRIIECQDFDYVEPDRKIVSRSEFIVPLYAEKEDRRICLWFYGPRNDASLVRLIETASQNLEDFIHFIILRGDVSASVFPVRLRKQTVHCSEEMKLKEKLEN